MFVDVAIVGSGIQGIILGVALKKYLGIDWVMIDPKTPGSKWFETTTRQGMVRLRTSYGRARHVDYGSDSSLIRFANRDRLFLERWFKPIDADNTQPSLIDFNAHVRKVIEDNELTQHWINSTVTSISPTGAAGDRFQITTAGGPNIIAKKVVVAVGLGEKFMPNGVFSNGKTIFHSDEIDIRDFWIDGPVCVVGGGMTAATIALALLHRSSYRVSLCMRNLSTSQLEADAAWAPGRGLHLWFQKISDMEERLRLNKSARIGRAVTPEKQLELIKEARFGQLKIHSGFNLTRVENNRDMVRIPGAGEFGSMICCTGYQADVSKLGFLKPLLRRIRVVGGLPVLDPSLQATNVPGLHFMGRLSELQSGAFGRNIPGAWWSTEQLLKVFKAL